MRKVGVGMIAASWLLLGGVIWLVMDGWVQGRQSPNADLAVTASAGPVVLKRDAAGHYVAPGRINGVAVTFMVDTGATTVALPAALAGEIGARRGVALRTQTAAGETLTYATRLARVELGGLAAEHVAGNIVPDMEGELVLLGMSFLSRFDIAIQDGQMRLSPK